MNIGNRAPWKVSLHGGHCGEFCDHARGTLRELLEAAIAYGYHTFGVSEHAPRAETRFLYAEEIELGWDVPKIEADFEKYGQAIRTLAAEFEGRLTVLRGFEVEMVPKSRYVELMQGHRRRHNFEYCVGSVHYVDDLQVDGKPAEFAQAVEQFGGLEGLAVRYYQCVAELVDALKPEVVGHLDLIRKNAPKDAPLDTPAIREAVDATLAVIKRNGGILDVNTAGYRKGLGSPYPAPWLVQRANQLGIGLCFGDDSHSTGDVGAGVDDARLYLLENGVKKVTYLTRRDGEIVRETAPLD